MRIMFGFMVLACGALIPPASGENPKKETKLEVFSVDGLFSIDTPVNGFKWAEVREIETENAKGRFYGCTKEGTPSRMALAMYERSVKDDQERLATLKAQYNTLLQSLKNGGFSDLKSAKPEMEPPIKDRIVLKVSGTSQRGQAHLYAITVFAKNTYMFQVFASSKEEAERFVKITESLKELKQRTVSGAESPSTPQERP